MHSIARHPYSHRDPRPYLQFLKGCIAECDRRHSPEEVAAAEDLLRKPKGQAQADLLLGVSNA